MQEEAAETEVQKNAVVNKNEKLVEIDEYGGKQSEESKGSFPNIVKTNSPKNQMEVDQSFDNPYEPLPRA